MSLRFGSGWLVIYFLICSRTFICSAPQLRARDCTTFNPFEPLPFSVTPDTRGFGSLDREGAPQAVVAWRLFRIPKGLKCVERREAGRGAARPANPSGTHKPCLKTKSGFGAALSSLSIGRRLRSERRGGDLLHQMAGNRGGWAYNETRSQKGRR